MSNLKAVYWDVDGTLANTEMDGHRAAFNSAFAEASIPWVWDINTYMGLLKIPGGTRRIISYSNLIREPIDISLAKQLHIIKQKHYLNIVKSGRVTLRPGIIRILDELQQSGIKQWVVTTSSKESVEALLEHSFGRDNPFDGYITKDDVNLSKPSPEPYLKAISYSGLDTNDSLAFEDSLVGLKAARGANLPCVITPSSWDNDLKYHWHDALAVLDHFGDPNNLCSVIKGPPCIRGQVTLEYLQNLILLAMP